MTIASEITRLQGAKADIKTAIENKGVTIPSSATIDTYSGYIDQIATVGPNDDMRYMYAVGSIDTDIIGVGSDNRLGDIYPDYSFKDSNHLYLIKPYIMDIRGSTLNFSVYLMAIPKGGNSIISGQFVPFSYSANSDIILSYYYINSGVVRFYGYEDRYDNRFGVEYRLSNGAWSSIDIGRDGTEPAETGGNQNLFSTTLKGNPSGRSQCIFQWKPN